MKIRIRFRKWGVMKFVGHLDTMRYFQKAIRRAGIDITYSAGYSPHQIMSFAAPLGVGLTSDGEYLDIEVNTAGPSKEAVEALNATMAEGVEVISFRKLPEDAKNAMSIVAAADYRVSFSPEARMPDLERLAGLFMAQSEMLITKKTKKSEAVTDLKPMIHELQARQDLLFMRLATGSAVNCKPVHVLEAMGAVTEPEAAAETAALQRVLSEMPYGIQIHRLQVYARKGMEEPPVFIPLEDLGEEIV